MPSSRVVKPAIAEKTRKHFTAIALNLWGDREVTWLDGRRLSEKALGQALKVQFTPTLLFLGADGKQMLRLNGYQPPDRFEAVLDYVAGRHEGREPLSDWLKRVAKEPASPSRSAPPFGASGFA